MRVLVVGASAALAHVERALSLGLLLDGQATVTIGADVATGRFEIDVVGW